MRRRDRPNSGHRGGWPGLLLEGSGGPTEDHPHGMQMSARADGDSLHFPARGAPRVPATATPHAKQKRWPRTPCPSEKYRRRRRRSHQQRTANAAGSKGEWPSVSNRFFLPHLKPPSAPPRSPGRYLRDSSDRISPDTRSSNNNRERLDRRRSAELRRREH